MTHDDYINILKDTLRKQATKTAVKIIISKVAFLGWGPFGPLLELVVSKILDILIDQTELATYLLYTDFRVARQGKKYSEALVENHEALINGTPEEKKIAEDNLKDAFRDFVKLGN